MKSFIFFLVFLVPFSSYGFEKLGIFPQFGHFQTIISVAFSPDGRYALSGNGDKTLKLWDVSNGKEVRIFHGHTDSISSVAFSPDGRYALSGSKDKTLKLWDVSTGKEVRTFHGHINYIYSVAFSPDGRYALSGARNKTLKLWNVSTGKEVRTFQSYLDYAYSVAFSPDGRYALSGGKGKDKDRILMLWDVYTGKEVRTFQGHADYISSVAFSPDGRYALSGSKDKTLKLWDVSNGKEVRTFHGHSEEIYSVAFSPDGRYALSGGKDQTLKLWDVSTGTQRAEFISFSDNEWVVITTNGYFNSSRNGAKFINVRVGNNVYGLEQFYGKFYRPELVHLVLAGEALPNVETFLDILSKKPAPFIQILSPKSGVTLHDDNTSLILNIQDNGGGIGGFDIYVNGTQVAKDTSEIAEKGRPENDEKLITIPVSLMEGQNYIRVVAFNKDNSMESKPAEINVILQTKQESQIFK